MIQLSPQRLSQFVGVSLFSILLLASVPSANAYNYTLMNKLLQDGSELVAPVAGCSRTAAGWLRIVFHDFGTYSVNNASTGGLDGSILTMEEANRKDNDGISSGGNTPFFRSLSVKYPSVSAPDWISLGGIVAIRECGGPDLRSRFRPGRNVTLSANPTGLLPTAIDNSTKLKDMFINRIGFNASDFLAIVLGSHSIGGVNVNQPNNTAELYGTRAFFISATAVLGIQSSEKALNGTSILPADNNLGADSEFKSTIQSLTANSTTFLQLFGDAYMRMIEKGQTNLGCRLDGSDCTTAQFVDSPISNQLNGFPSAWLASSSSSGSSNSSSSSSTATSTASQTSKAVSHSLLNSYDKLIGIVVGFFMVAIFTIIV